MSTLSRYGAIALVVFGFLIWASDQITLQGERTIYTVNCERGIWDNLHCEETMVAGGRYRYKASKSRHEVIFWIAGSSNPSGRFTDCNVVNRGNWSCNATLGVTPSITYKMVNDRATHGTTGLTVPFHAVPKWQWWLLRAGIHAFDHAAY